MADADGDDPSTPPPELEAVLAADPEVRRLFDALPERDRTYWSDYVREAKQATTRARRAERVAVELPAKAAEKAERRARGTDDLGGRFGRLVIDAVGADLRAAGYRPRAKGKHWRRATAERADLIGFHTFRRVSHEFAELRLEGGVHLPILDEAAGGTPQPPGSVVTEAGMAVRDGLSHEDTHFAITADVDDEALKTQIRRVVLARMAAIEALGDLSDPEAVLAACRRHWPRRLPAALEATGPHDEARHAVLAVAALHAAGGDDPRTVRSLVHLAGRCGLPVEDLPEPVPAGELPVAATRPVVARIFAALGDTVSWCVGRRDGTVDLQLLEPTEAQVAEARAIAGDVPLRLDVVDVSLDDQTRLLRALHEVLLARERHHDDLVAHVAAWSIGRFRVEVADLDPGTEAVIRATVPDRLLTIDATRPAAVLLVEKRQRLAGPVPEITHLADILEISRTLGADGRGALG